MSAQPKPETGPLWVRCSSCGAVFPACRELVDDVCPKCNAAGCLSERFTRSAPIEEVGDGDFPDQPEVEPSAEAVKIATRLRQLNGVTCPVEALTIHVAAGLADLLADRDQWAARSRATGDMLDIVRAHRRSLTAERDRLATIVGRLPVSADGVPLVPNIDTAWYVEYDGHVFSMAAPARAADKSAWPTLKFYSTEAAALAAKGASE